MPCSTTRRIGLAIRNAACGCWRSRTASNRGCGASKVNRGRARLAARPPTEARAGRIMATELEELRDVLRRFAAERDWDQFHSPKNLASALAVEAAELLERFQWLTEEQSRN